MTQEVFLDRIDEIMCGTSNAERAYLADLYDEVNAPHWISVIDEMPKKEGRYLFYDEILGPQVSIYFDGCTLDSSITHWMPLPQPPTVQKMQQSKEKGGEE